MKYALESVLCSFKPVLKSSQPIRIKWATGNGILMSCTVLKNVHPTGGIVWLGLCNLRK